MSLVRIDNEKGRTFGWQARRRITGTKKYKSAFFSDLKYGSDRKSLELAKQALSDMTQRWSAGTQARPRTSDEARRMARARWDKAKTYPQSMRQWTCCVRIWNERN